MLQLLRTPIGRLRIVGFLEGISLLVLIFVAMPLKYWGGDARLVQMIGPVHGLLFVWFVFLTLSISVTYRWKFSETSWKVLLASLIPFGTFYIDKYLLTRQQAARESHQD